MRNDPYIDVECNVCMHVEQIQLTALAQGYDERYVNDELDDMGWEYDEATNYDICDVCLEEQREQDKLHEGR